MSRAALDAALAGLQAETIRRIDFVPRRGPALVARFVGETSRFQAAAGQVSLQIWTVPSGERKHVEQALLEDGLARLRAWLDQVGSAGSTWRATSHSFALAHSGGTLVVRKD